MTYYAIVKYMTPAVETQQKPPNTTGPYTSPEPFVHPDGRMAVMEFDGTFVMPLPINGDGTTNWIAVDHTPDYTPLDRGPGERAVLPVPEIQSLGRLSLRHLVTVRGYLDRRRERKQVKRSTLLAQDVLIPVSNQGNTELRVLPRYAPSRESSTSLSSSESASKQVLADNAMTTLVDMLDLRNNQGDKYSATDEGIPIDQATYRRAWKKDIHEGRLGRPRMPILLLSLDKKLSRPRRTSGAHRTGDTSKAIERRQFAAQIHESAENYRAFLADQAMETVVAMYDLQDKQGNSYNDTHEGVPMDRSSYIHIWKDHFSGDHINPKDVTKLLIILDKALATRQIPQEQHPLSADQPDVLAAEASNYFAQQIHVAAEAYRQRHNAPKSPKIPFENTKQIGAVSTARTKRLGALATRPVRNLFGNQPAQTYETLARADSTPTRTTKASPTSRTPRNPTATVAPNTFAKTPATPRPGSIALQPSEPIPRVNVTSYLRFGAVETPQNSNRSRRVQSDPASAGPSMRNQYAPTQREPTNSTARKLGKYFALGPR
jgi:hypothetical protein